VLQVNVRRRLALAVLAVATSLAACASHEAPQPHRYTESISSVLLSEDGTRVAAIGSNHHYIFDAPGVLVQALHSPIHPQLAATFSTFHVDQRGVVTGDWLLTLAADAPAASQQAAQALGFVRGTDGLYAAGGRLKGQRFTGWTYKLRGPKDKLNKAYVIEVTTDASAADVAVDDAATPIRLAADGVQLIYWAPLAPVIVPILFMSRATDH
jgi:hypothetical protein